jgi:hypothetical protein
LLKQAGNDKDTSISKVWLYLLQLIPWGPRRTGLLALGLHFHVRTLEIKTSRSGFWICTLSANSITIFTWLHHLRYRSHPHCCS